MNIPYLKKLGNLLNIDRDGARFLQLLIFNEESLVCASHQLAQNTSLSFVHTARRTYRLDDPARSLEENLNVNFGLQFYFPKLFKPYHLEEGEVVTRSP